MEAPVAVLRPLLPCASAPGPVAVFELILPLAFAPNPVATLELESAPVLVSLALALVPSAVRAQGCRTRRVGIGAASNTADANARHRPGGAFRLVAVGATAAHELRLRRRSAKARRQRNRECHRQRHGRRRNERQPHPVHDAPTPAKNLWAKRSTPTTATERSAVKVQLNCLKFLRLWRIQHVFFYKFI